MRKNNIERYEKECLVVQWLEGLKHTTEPITIAKHKTICNPKLFAELHITRLKNPPTQTIYNNSLQEVSILKREIENAL